MRSDNFSFLKSASIIFVVAGHYYKDVTALWVPVAFGLMTFSYSSSYFTALKYREGFSLSEYWLQKANRLGINLLVINVFMGAVCLLRGCADLFSWQTLIHFFGMTGFLEWLELPVSNALTGGRWFLTVLLLFYLLYPLLLKVFKKRWWIISTILVLMLIENEFNYRGNPRFGLYITSVAFMYGFCVGRTGTIMGKVQALIGLSVLGIAAWLLIFKYKIGDYNFIFLCLLFFLFANLIESIWLPNILKRAGRFVEKYLLEIYLIHAAFYVQLTGNQHLDFLVSFFLVLLVAMGLSGISGLIRERLVGRAITIAN